MANNKTINTVNVPWRHCFSWCNYWNRNQIYYWNSQNHSEKARLVAPSLSTFYMQSRATASWAVVELNLVYGCRTWTLSKKSEKMHEQLWRAMSTSITWDFSEKWEARKEVIHNGSSRVTWSIWEFGEHLNEERANPVSTRFANKWMVVRHCWPWRGSFS